MWLLTSHSQPTADRANVTQPTYCLPPSACAPGGAARVGETGGCESAKRWHPSVPAGEIGPAACSTARSATTCVASRRVAAAYGVAHLALRTPFYVQNHDTRSASTVVTRPWWAAKHCSTGVVLFSSRPAYITMYRPHAHQWSVHSLVARVRVVGATEQDACGVPILILRRPLGRETARSHRT